MKHIVAAFALVSMLSFAGTASAQAVADEGARPLGLRLEVGLIDFNLVAPGVERLAFVNPHGDLRVGYDLDSGLTPLIGLGYRRFSTSTESKQDGVDDTDASASAITISLEVRYYLQKHRKGLQPFVWGELNTSFVSAEENGETDDLAEEQGDHTELNLGFGAEYKFTRAFAVGGKWGLGFGFQPYENKNTKSDTSNTTIGTSSSVYLAWRL